MRPQPDRGNSSPKPTFTIVVQYLGVACLDNFRFQFEADPNGLSESLMIAHRRCDHVARCPVLRSHMHAESFLLEEGAK